MEVSITQVSEEQRWAAAQDCLCVNLRSLDCCSLSFKRVTVHEFICKIRVTLANGFTKLVCSKCMRINLYIFFSVFPSWTNELQCDMVVCNLSIQQGIEGKWRPLLRHAVRNMIHAKCVTVCVCFPAIRMWAVHLWHWRHRPLSSCRLCPSTVCQPRLPAWEMLPWMPGR